ncbi:MAG TPA: helix-turn-helix transcriptional regulator, partial [Candidatus Binatia bacterium]
MTGRKLKEVRKLSGLSQTAFGAKIKATQAQITAWERSLYPIPEWAEENIRREFSPGGPSSAMVPVIGYVSAGETDVHYDDQGFPVGGGIDEVDRPVK